MKRYYSPSTQVTYLDGIHAAMPSDVREISERRFMEVIGNAPPGKTRGHDADGLPVLLDPQAPELESAERIWRDARIEAVRWIRDRHQDELDLGRRTSIAVDQYAGLLAYLQALRDWPESNGFPDSAARPTPPDWLANLSS